MERKFKGHPLFMSVFRRGHRSTWTAILRNGEKVTILSEVGTDAQGNTFRFDGECRDGMRHGRGLFSHGKGLRYHDGYWRNSEKQGYAIVQYHETDEVSGLYEGVWDKTHMRHGPGKHIWPNGNWYEGEWMHNYQHGRYV